MKYFRLNDGYSIPSLGFGTWKAKDGQEAYQAVLSALELGYRHIDTAAIYGNEESIGQAIRDSGIRREELFVTTKLWNTAHTYQDVQRALEDSLSKLKLEYIDLYLIHWPNPKLVRENWQERNRVVWKAMEDLQIEGKIKSIGVSNFMVRHLETLLATARVVPAVNQIRLAPGVYQEEIVQFCREKGVLLEAWGPFGQGELFTHPELVNMVKKYGVSVSQLALMWSLQEGFLPLPKSVTPERIKENLIDSEIVLETEDRAILKNLEGVTGAPNPDEVDF